ncbi:wiskott-Aldrich syndrome protein homolog 1-like [Hordeum vulgare subsp. vulgare]|uniref:wiskott-Aldrich syndrome protein homolog 1-like n=1 Tax=Hordeum vulgare subsp. vulgare TaxID=112509 RepID=UPI001D1A4E59|nr:wiskott-Aldrich syndrome protein homolog 1-like [Hordeum vulgare subsp. vulgare]
MQQGRNGNARCTLSEFMRNLSPTFIQADEPLDVDGWIRTFEDLLALVNCDEDPGKVLYYSHYLGAPAPPPDGSAPLPVARGFRRRSYPRAPTEQTLNACIRRRLSAWSTPILLPRPTASCPAPQFDRSRPPCSPPAASPPPTSGRIPAIPSPCRSILATSSSTTSPRIHPQCKIASVASRRQKPVRQSLPSALVGRVLTPELYGDSHALQRMRPLPPRTPVCPAPGMVLPSARNCHQRCPSPLPVPARGKKTNLTGGFNLSEYPWDGSTYWIFIIVIDIISPLCVVAQTPDCGNFCYFI